MRLSASTYLRATALFAALLGAIIAESGSAATADGDSITVELQQGLGGYGGSTDTELSRWARNSNFGEDTEILESAGPYVPLFRFAIFASEGGPVPDGAVVESATLSLYKHSAYNHQYAVHRVKVPWQESQATWNGPSAGSSWSQEGASGLNTDIEAVADGLGSADFQPGWVNFDVLSGVKAMAAGAANNGWRLLPLGGNGNLKRFHSSEHASGPTLRPKLLLTYKVDNRSPQVSITAPGDGSSFEVGDSIPVSTVATDDDGEVVLVEYYANGVKIGESTQSPHALAWVGAEEGTQVLSAVATDDDGASATSQSLSVSVTAPANGGGTTDPGDGGTPPAPPPTGFGWHELADTVMEDVCPASNFGGTGYAFDSKCDSVTEAWNSGVFDPNRNRLYMWGGGHHDYYGNEVYALDLNQSRMLRLTDPATPLADEDAPKPGWSELAPFNGTQPNSRHTYDGLAFIQHADLMWAFSGALSSRATGWDNLTWLFDPQTLTWSKANPSGDIPNGDFGVLSAYDPVSGLVFLHDRTGLFSYQYSEAGGVYTRLNNDGGYNLHKNAVIDPVRRLFIVVGKGEAFYYDISSGSDSVRQPLDSSGATEIIAHQAPGMAFDPVTGDIVGWVGDGRIYRLDTDTMTWSSTAFDAGPGEQHKQGTYGRFAYAPSLDGFAVYNDAEENAFVFIPPRGIIDSQIPSAPTGVAGSAPLPAVVKLEWSPATDDFGIEQYRVYRDGVLVAQSGRLTHAELSLQASRTYRYHVTALDSAGNESPPSDTVTIVTPAQQVELPLGNCSGESALAGRDDVVFCEPWEDANWWQNGYLNDPIVNDPRAALSADVEDSKIVSEGCFSGSCLKVNMLKDKKGALSLHWPLNNAGLAPEELFLRYYIRLAPDWSPDMCDAEGNVVGAGGKFPGLADPRTWADPSNQCGNGGDRADGLNCWSMRSTYRNCKSGDDEACATKPDAVTRFGSYLYNYGQPRGTGSPGHWDSDDWNQETVKGESCQTHPRHLYCGIGDGGVMVPDRWYRIEMQVRMNTPGQEDGTIRGWVDGALSYEKTNVIFRIPEHDMLHNRVVWLNVYKGGRDGNCNDSAIFLDELVVTTDAPPGGVNSDTAQPPTLNFQASKNAVQLGESLELSWSAQDANSCTSSGAWSGPRPPQGTETVQPGDSVTHYDIACSGTGGIAARRISVEVAGGGIPAGDPGPSGDNAPPDAPGQPSASVVTRDTVILTWDVPDDDKGVTGYRVYRDGVLVASPTTPVLEDTDLAPGTSFLYEVEALDAAGNFSGRSVALRVTTHGESEGATSGTVVVFSDSDSYTHPSTSKPQGDLERLVLGDNGRVYIRFPLSGIGSGAVIASARLQLHTNRQYGDSNPGVFRATQYWHEGSMTRDYVDRTAGRPWDNVGGDWEDATGVPQGNVPFATPLAEDPDMTGWVEWDVTELVSAWQQGTVANQGLVIRMLGGAPHNFDAQEAPDSSLQPRIVIELAEGEPTDREIAVGEDTYLSSSTHKSLGDDARLHISGDWPSLLRFDFSDIGAASQIEQATLRMYSYSQSGKEGVAGIFTPDKPWSESGATSTYYDRDMNLPWDAFLGDWLDAEGTPQGAQAFSQSVSPNDGSGKWVEWDVTELVQRWVDGSMPNHGILLRSVSGGSQSFHSKDSDHPDLAPYLSIKVR